LPTAQTFVEVYGQSADVGAFVADFAPGAQCDATSSCTSFSDVSGTQPEALTFTPRVGRDYYLIVDGPAEAAFNVALHCSTGSTCRPARAIAAGQTIVSDNMAGRPGVTNAQITYFCQGGSHTAPETSFLFTPATSGSYRIDLTNQSASLTLFVVDGPDCNTTCSSAATCSRSPAGGDESCTLSGEAHKSYFIVVDGFNPGTFTLGVTRL
jgi:hypothetical protein